MIKAFYILRQDVEMSTAKKMVQVAHGTDLIWSFSISCKAVRYFDEWISEYSRRKIVLKVGTLEKLENLEQVLIKTDILFSEIIDEGFTELNGRTKTGIVIYPLDEDLLPKQIKRLRLYD